MPSIDPALLKCYLKDFSGKASADDQSKQAKALENALDVRKFEIDLYWKRAAYFWALIAATFAAYFALRSRADPTPPIVPPAASIHELDLLTLLVASVGLVLSVAWFLVNQGSKYWQENWEWHVDLLEDEVMGPLHKTVFSRVHSTWPFSSSHPYSVTKINQVVSAYIVLIWVGLIVATVPRLRLVTNLPWSPSDVARLWFWVLLLLAITVAALGVLIRLGKRTPDGTPHEMKFEKRTLPPREFQAERPSSEVVGPKPGGNADPTSSR